MATLHIREFKKIGRAKAGDADYEPGPVMIAKEPGKDQIVTFTASTQSAPFSSVTRFILLSCDQSYHYAVGEDPTATTNNMKIPAFQLVWFGVTPGHKIAVLAA